MASLVADMENNGVLGNIGGDTIKELAAQTVRALGQRFAPQIIARIANRIGPNIANVFEHMDSGAFAQLMQISQMGIEGKGRISFWSGSGQINPLMLSNYKSPQYEVYRKMK